ncbi:hypothetical protein [Anoxybacter fermentans]|nr:hypothetical protein [Anoxybacter fermentans]
MEEVPFDLFFLQSQLFRQHLLYLKLMSVFVGDGKGPMPFEVVTDVEIL